MARGDTFKKRDNSFLNDKMNFDVEPEEFVPAESELDNLNSSEEVVFELQNDIENHDNKYEDPSKDSDGTPIDWSDLPKKDRSEKSNKNEEDSGDKKPSKKANALSFMSDTEAMVAKTFKIREDVVEAFDSLFEDSRGRKIKGVRGMMSKVATNALIKELVELGALDEDYLNKLESY